MRPNLRPSSFERLTKSCGIWPVITFLQAAPTFVLDRLRKLKSANMFGIATEDNGCCPSVLLSKDPLPRREHGIGPSQWLTAICGQLRDSGSCYTQEFRRAAPL